MKEQLFREWTIILRMIMAEDLSLLKLQNLCIEHRANYNNCYKHLLLIHKMSYKRGRQFVNNLLENYIKMNPIKKNKFLPAVTPLKVPQQSRIPQQSHNISPHLTSSLSLVDLYEFEAGDILSTLKFKKC